MVVYWKEYPNEDFPSSNYSLHSSIALIETMIDEHKRGLPINTLSSGDVLTNDQMKMTIRHFMKLFDVRKESGVYTRMHDIYVRYYEMANAFRSIQQMLHLGKNKTLEIFE